MKLKNPTIKDAGLDIEIMDQLMNGKISKGKAIKHFFGRGFDVKEISDKLGIKYNHVYNVCSSEVTVGGLEVVKQGRGNNEKREQIIKLLREGKTIKEVAEETKTLYNSIWQIAKAHGLTKKQRVDALVADVEKTLEEDDEAKGKGKKGKKGKVSGNDTKASA